MREIPKKILIGVMLFASAQSYGQFEKLKETANDGYVDNKGIKIHYLQWGNGPLMVMLHGFPDFWYSWRGIIPEFSKDYKVVAIDLRGYNLSDKPSEVDRYTIKELRTDVIAIIDHFKEKKAILVANDWGGAIAWSMALYTPERVEKLIVCNIPFPSNIGKYLAEHPEVGEYARKFQSGSSLVTPESLLAYLPDKKQNKYYLEAFQKSDIDAMLNYYKASYPTPNQSSSGTSSQSTSLVSLPNVKCPVLMIYGMQDNALPPAMLNNSWDRIDNNLMLYTIPNAGHFIQQERPETVNKVIRAWLSISR